MSAIVYRTGIDRRTGEVLTGWAHLAQCLEDLWTTPLTTLVMALDFGSNLRARLAEDIDQATALGIYDDLITSAEANEPEYRIKEMQLVRLKRDGSLGLRHAGLYYPEGRLGNYAIALPVGDTIAMMAARLAARGVS